MTEHHIGKGKEDQYEREQDRGHRSINKAQQEIELNLRLASIESDASRVHSFLPVLLGLNQEEVLQVVDYQRL